MGTAGGIFYAISAADGSQQSIRSVVPRLGATMSAFLHWCEIKIDSIVSVVPVPVGMSTAPVLSLTVQGALMACRAPI